MIIHHDAFINAAQGDIRFFRHRLTKRLRPGRLVTVISAKSLTRNNLAKGSEDGSNKRTKVSRMSPV